MLINSRTSKRSPTTIVLCLFLKIVGTILKCSYRLLRINSWVLINHPEQLCKGIFPILMSHETDCLILFVYSPRIQAVPVVWQGLVDPANVELAFNDLFLMAYRLQT